MYYFKFTIPQTLRAKDKDSMPGYPPNWYGEMTWPPAPSSVTVLLQDDGAGFGVAKTTDNIITTKTKGDFQIITEAEALKLVSDASGDLAYKVDRMPARWIAKVEPLPEYLTDITLDEFREFIDGR
jgi:hypothetical protein